MGDMSDDAEMAAWDMGYTGDPDNPGPEIEAMMEAEDGEYAESLLARAKKGDGVAVSTILDIVASGDGSQAETLLRAHLVNLLGKKR